MISRDRFGIIMAATLMGVGFLVPADPRRDIGALPLPPEPEGLSVGDLLRLERAEEKRARKAAKRLREGGE